MEERNGDANNEAKEAAYENEEGEEEEEGTVKGETVDDEAAEGETAGDEAPTEKDEEAVEEVTEDTVIAP